MSQPAASSWTDQMHLRPGGDALAPAMRTIRTNCDAPNGYHFVPRSMWKCFVEQTTIRCLECSEWASLGQLGTSEPPIGGKQ